jgi:hypothetical protein
MRISKYLNLRSGNWICVAVNIASITPSFKPGTRDRYISAGHRRYEYTFQRPTSDGKAFKVITLTADQARLVLNGQKTVEEYAKQKKLERPVLIKKKVSYNFCD